MAEDIPPAINRKPPGEYRRESSDGSSGSENNSSGGQKTDEQTDDITKTPDTQLNKTPPTPNKDVTPPDDEITEENIAKIQDVITGGGRPLPTRWSEIPEYLYKKDSKRYNAAKQFIVDGERDIKVLSKDNGLTEGTVFNIRSDIHGVINEIKKQKGIKTPDEKPPMRRPDEKSDEDEDYDEAREDDDEKMKQMRNEGAIVVRGKVDARARTISCLI